MISFNNLIQFMNKHLHFLWPGKIHKCIPVHAGPIPSIVLMSSHSLYYNSECKQQQNWLYIYIYTYVNIKQKSNPEGLKV